MPGEYEDIVVGVVFRLLHTPGDSEKAVEGVAVFAMCGVDGGTGYNAGAATKLLSSGTMKLAG